MCGIYFIKSNNNIQQFNATSDIILEKLKYRGPDSCHIEKVNDNFFIAHTLLAIQGYQEQPIKTTNGYLLFNGEIYNQSTFDNDCLYLKDFLDNQSGLENLDKLDGEFTICYFNNDKLHVIIDPFHTKPFCMYLSNDTIIGSSYSSCIEKTLNNNSNLTKDIIYFKPNTHYIFDLEKYQLISEKEIVKWDFEPKYTSFDRWNIAFENSIKKRVETDKGVFVPLSSGYDSGAIVCALLKLNTSFSAYNFKGCEDINTLEKRRMLINSNSISDFRYINPKDNANEKYTEYIKRIENYTGYHYDGSPYTDIYDAYSCFGLFQIFQVARSNNKIIFLSGHGGDEIYSDYGNKENCGASTLHLDYTNVRSKWPNFDSGYGRNIIQMFERVGGCYGIESRYPFLDKQLVQEFLWLSDELKNKEFKQCIAQYMESNNFPYLKNKKCGVKVFTKKEGGNEFFQQIVKQTKEKMNIKTISYPVYKHQKNPRPNLDFKPEIRYYPKVRFCINTPTPSPNIFNMYTNICKNQEVDINIKNKIINITALQNDNTPGIKYIYTTQGNGLYTIKYKLKCETSISIYICNHKNININSLLTKRNYDAGVVDNEITIATCYNYIYIYILFTGSSKLNKCINIESISIKPKPLLCSPLINSESSCDILMLTLNDWSNTCFRFAQCLKLIGLNVCVFKGKDHRYGYPQQAPISDMLTTGKKGFPPIVKMIRENYISQLMKQASIINMHASTFINATSFMDYSKLTITATHGGTAYRDEPSQCNSIFNDFSKKTIIQCPDLLGLGAKNEVLVYYPVDTDFIKPDFTFKDTKKLIIGHFPSNPETKGTSTILQVINELKKTYNNFEYNGNQGIRRSNCTWDKQLAKFKKCDVLIETVNTEIQGKKYGEWGNTCLEAAASGCIVLTNTLSEQIYIKEYGCTPEIMISNNSKQLKENLIKLFNLSREELLELKKKTRKWAEEKHSFKATGIRLWEKVYKDLLPDKNMSY